MPAADPTLEARLSKAEAEIVTLKAEGELLAKAVADLQAAGPALLREQARLWLELAGPEGEPVAPCPQCGQLPGQQSGEYPCSACGEPTLHDPEGPEGEPPPGTGGNE
jgi:hypothetical protein